MNSAIGITTSKPWPSLAEGRAWCGQDQSWEGVRLVVLVDFR